MSLFMSNKQKNIKFTLIENCLLNSILHFTQR